MTGDQHSDSTPVLLADVTPAVHVLLVRHWRETPAWQKLAYVNELNAALKTLALSDLRRRFPNDSEARLQRRLASRWLGDALAARVYGPLDGADASD